MNKFKLCNKTFFPCGLVLSDIHQNFEDEMSFDIHYFLHAETYSNKDPEIVKEKWEMVYNACNDKDKQLTFEDL